MATELIAIAAAGNTPSGDITAVAGTPVTLFLKVSATEAPMPADCKAVIEIKSSGGQYFPVGELSQTAPVKVIDGAGTYRVVKASGASFGVDQG